MDADIAVHELLLKYMDAVNNYVEAQTNLAERASELKEAQELKQKAESKRLKSRRSLRAQRRKLEIIPDIPVATEAEVNAVADLRNQSSWEGRVKIWRTLSVAEKKELKLKAGRRQLIWC